MHKSNNEFEFNNYNNNKKLESLSKKIFVFLIFVSIFYSVFAFFSIKTNPFQ